jgi:hypothetical protein
MGVDVYIYICVYVNYTDILSEAEFISEAPRELNVNRLKVLQNIGLGIGKLK